MNNFQDMYLIFQNEQEAFSVLYDGEKPLYQNIDVIGTVYQPAPIPVPEDYQPIPYPAPNFGVNVRVLENEDITPLLSYAVSPKPYPERVWA